MNMKTIDWKVENEMGHLVLDQPPANIMTRLFFEELAVVTRSLIPDSSIQALIIYGKGRHFSAGADHIDLRSRISKSILANPDNKLPDFMKQTMESFLILHELQIPTFAAIRGTCLGSALELALTCKYRICAEGTVLGLPETSFGLMPGCGGTIMLPAITNLHNAIELILSGRNFSASEAVDYGIVHKVVPRDLLLDETIRLAEHFIKR